MTSLSYGYIQPVGYPFSSHAELTSHHLSPQTQDIVHMWNVVFDDFVVS